MEIVEVLAGFLIAFFLLIMGANYVLGMVGISFSKSWLRSGLSFFLSILRFPLTLLKGLLNLKASTLDCMVCPECEREISLLGRHECSCGFIFQGRYFSPCPHCGEIKTYIECECGRHILRPFWIFFRRD